ncbi:hypothetical protein RB601_002301 [Gaeumannomyces tritici]
MFSHDFSVLVCLYLLLVPVTGLGGRGNPTKEEGFSPRDTPLRRALARSRIAPRQAGSGSCLASEDTPCSRGYPTTFCCQKDETCMSLAGHTTALCCPKGSNCEVLSPISCSISQQDVKTFPYASVVTTELDTPLPRCAEGCCPFGYTCDPDRASFCVRNEDQSRFLAPAKSSSTLKPTPLPGVFVQPTTTVANSLPGVSVIQPTTLATLATGSSSSSASSTSTSEPTAAPAETAAAANGTAAATGPSSAPSARSVAVAVGSSLGAFAVLVGLLAAAYIKRGKLSAMASSVAAARRSRSRSISTRDSGDGDSSPHNHHYFKFGRGGGGGGDQHSPPPPPYPHADQQPLHLSLDQCKRIPRRKTVPSQRRPEMAAAEPVELPASPVPWGPRAAAAARSSRGSQASLPRRSRAAAAAAAAEAFFLPRRPTVEDDGGGDRPTSFRMHPRTGTNLSFSRPFHQAQQPPPEPEPRPPPSAWPHPLRLKRGHEQPYF